MEEVSNPNQVEQLVEELIWLVHIVGLWTCNVNHKKQAYRGLKNHWWCAIVVCAQAIKNESKWKWRHPYVSIARGMKSSPLWLLNVWLCILLNNHHCCMCYHHWCSLHHNCASWISNDDIHQGLEIVSGDKDVHSSLYVARSKVRDLLSNMCSILQSNVMIISQNVSWVIVHSLPWGTETNGY
jgi:hypothetical protein